MSKELKNKILGNVARLTYWEHRDWELVALAVVEAFVGEPDKVCVETAGNTLVENIKSVIEKESGGELCR